MMKIEPMSQEGQAEVRAFCAPIVDAPIEWRPELYQLMGCAMALMNAQCDRDNPLQVLEDYAAVTALLCYAASVDWVTDDAAKRLCAFARFNRNETFKKWSGQLVTVTRGGAAPQNVTKH